MSRQPSDRFDDIRVAIGRCAQYRTFLENTDASLVAMAYDAILRNLAVIGEAVRALSPEIKQVAPDVPWASIAGLRNIVVHEYFRVDRGLIGQIVRDELAPLAAAIDSLSTGE